MNENYVQKSIFTASRYKADKGATTSYFLIYNDKTNTTFVCFFTAWSPHGGGMPFGPCLHGGLVGGEDHAQPLQVVVSLPHSKVKLPQLLLLLF